MDVGQEFLHVLIGGQDAVAVLDFRGEVIIHGGLRGYFLGRNRHVDGFFSGGELAFDGGHRQGDRGVAGFHARNGTGRGHRSDGRIGRIVGNRLAGVGGGADRHGLALFHGHVVGGDGGSNGLVLGFGFGLGFRLRFRFVAAEQGRYQESCE